MEMKRETRTHTHTHTYTHTLSLSLSLSLSLCCSLIHQTHRMSGIMTGSVIHNVDVQDFRSSAESQTESGPITENTTNDDDCFHY